MKEQNIHYLTVGEDSETCRIIATGSIVIELKFIHSCGLVGHIEDIVVAPEARGRHIGQHLIEHLTHIAQQKGCYKVILDFVNKVKEFYEKCGYQSKGIEMAHFLIKTIY